MKFGKSIGSQQEGHSDLHYVEYKLLKKRIKDVVACLQASELAEALTANTAFEEELAAEIYRVNNCFAQRQHELLDRTAALSEELHQRQSGAQDSAGSKLGAQRGSSGSISTKADALRRLVDVLHEVDQLRKYAVWNAVAVVKILKKRRKQTSFGIEDSSAERAGWLSRQTFFSGSDFAELHASIESLGHMLVLSEILPKGTAGHREASTALRPHAAQSGQEPQQCPICLDTISDMVELSCNHRFCWKCFVLGPIAFRPGEYRITQCPICRRETSQGSAAVCDAAQESRGPEASAAASSSSPSGGHFQAQASIADGFCPGSVAPPTTEGVLSRFLHTYFPREVLRSSDDSGCGGESKDVQSFEEEEEDMRDSVGELVKVLLADCNVLQQFTGGSSGSDGPASSSSDFFDTLPMRPLQDKQHGAAQKLQWLQLASTGDPFALDDNMYCALCSEPLMMEAVVSTPCKHHFHRVCISRIDMPTCPLCTTALPFSWFLPAEHPCAEHGFRTVLPHNYRPMFAGGPSKGSCGYPLRRPPPASLHGAEGLKMRSYLHRLIPTGSSVGEEEDEEAPTTNPGSPEVKPSTPAAQDLADAEDEESSSEESNSEDDDEEDGEAGPASDFATRRSARSGTRAPPVFAYSAVGRMRLLDRRPRPAAGSDDVNIAQKEQSSQAAPSGRMESRQAAQDSQRGGGAESGATRRNSKVLNLGDYL
eukprot:gb/GFBE01030342.1/.p1 GENE.gb/GFBE01030342.1/~~gb/GFBE01030342.1/.p1  ORF type:complete len:709 (+),score=129.24 gb/GFBE01030342.1/:1-2127(+)